MSRIFRLALGMASSVAVGTPGIFAQVADRAGTDSATRAAEAYHARYPHEYAAERAAMREAGAGRVARAGGVLRLRLASGRVVALADTLADDDRHRRVLYRGFLLTLGLHVVEMRFYEGWVYAVYHDRAGQEAGLPGFPLASPDGRRFAAASCDLEAGYQANAIEVWRVTPDGLHREFAYDAGEAWGPDSLAWDGPTRLRFRRVTLARDGTRASTPASLTYRAGRWSLDLGRP